MPRYRRWTALAFAELLVLVETVISLPQRQPNFVLILTDDLDLTLNGAASLTKTKRLLAGHGADLPSWYVHTPVCCSSRAELLTGRMFHNIKVPSPDSPGCMHVDVTSDRRCRFYARDYFARYFKDKGYTVGVFGKHLNTKNPDGPPIGVDRWLVNGGGDYLNPSFDWASAGVDTTHVRFNNCTDSEGKTQDCYSTSVIGNASISWIHDHLSVSDTPFFAYVSVKAPHILDGPGFPMAIPAPWYTNASVGTNTNAPRTPNYNASCVDHHWLVRQQPPITNLEASKVDELYVSRLRSLLSVDDLVEDMVSTLDELGVLDDTYILFTSDNGYRLGQFRIPQGKWHPYENDLRVPFMIRGPGIQPGSVRKDILGTHVDIMPTLLGLLRKPGSADNLIPPTMDGENLAPLLLNDESWRRRQQRLRTAILIEYVAGGPVYRYGHLEDSHNNTFRALRVIGTRQNLKYVEFTDPRVDWNFTKEPEEYELFNLDNDPFEMKNIYSTSPTDLISRLHDMTWRLFTCSGQDCRDAANDYADIFPVDWNAAAKVS